MELLAAHSARGHREPADDRALDFAGRRAARVRASSGAAGIPRAHRGAASQRIWRGAARARSAKACVEWCACYVSWCADQCGYIESGIIPKFAGCVDGANWFKGNGQWQDRNYEPQAGDIIFFDWEGDGETDHVGIVEKCENGVVYTVEGNSGDACRQNQYTVGSSSIYGYGVPAY